LSREPIVPVLFRVWRHRTMGSGVIAIFPTIDEGGGRVQMFEHIGQHGAGDLHGVINRTRPATPEEYAPLKRELEGAPYRYRLRVVQRASRRLRERHDPVDRRYPRGRARKTSKRALLMAVRLAWRRHGRHGPGDLAAVMNIGNAMERARKLGVPESEIERAKREAMGFKPYRAPRGSR